jgi:hypothetical protein
MLGAKHARALMAEFIEIQTTHLTGSTAMAGEKVVIATSQVVTVNAGKNNSSEILLLNGAKLNVATSYDEMKRKLGVTP